MPAPANPYRTSRRCGGPAQPLTRHAAQVLPCRAKPGLQPLQVWPLGPEHDTQFWLGHLRSSSSGRAASLHSAQGSDCDSVLVSVLWRGAPCVPAPAGLFSALGWHPRNSQLARAGLAVQVEGFLQGGVSLVHIRADCGWGPTQERSPQQGASRAALPNRWEGLGGPAAGEAPSCHMEAGSACPAPP